MKVTGMYGKVICNILHSTRCLMVRLLQGRHMHCHQEPSLRNSLASSTAHNAWTCAIWTLKVWGKTEKYGKHALMCIALWLTTSPIDWRPLSAVSGCDNCGQTACSTAERARRSKIQWSHMVLWCPIWQDNFGHFFSITCHFECQKRCSST